MIDVVDHRMFADYAAFPHAKFRVEPIGAAATQIAECFYFDRTATLDRNHAALLLCGIYSNTVNFRADTTTFRDHRMKDWLVEIAGADLAQLPHQMLEHKSHYALEHLDEILRSDAKDGYTEFGLDSPLVVFQLETTLGEETLANQTQLLATMHRLYPQRKHQLLVLQDIKQGQTWLLASDTDVQHLLRRTHLQIMETDQPTLTYISNITMRKSILHALSQAKNTAH